MTQPTAFSYSRLNNFETCPKQFHEVHILKRVKEEESQAMLEGKATHKALELRVSKNKPLPAHLAKHEEVIAKLVALPVIKQTELQLAIDANYAPCEWFDRKTYCRAIVDLGLKAAESAVLIDYKTGKQSDDFTQMRLTGAVYFHNHPEINRLSLTYAWLKNGKSTTEAMKRSEIPDVWGGLMPRIERYQYAFKNTEFPARPDRHCRWCPVKTCPHWEGKS